MIIEIMVGGKKYSKEYLGIKDTDMVRIKKNELGQARLMKSTDGKNWEIVDCPENYGWPSIHIIRS